MDHSMAEQEQQTPPLPPPIHAYHQYLPDYCKDEETGVPFVTTFAKEKVKEFIQLVLSIQLTDGMFVETTTTTTTTTTAVVLDDGDNAPMRDDDDGVDDDDDDDDAAPMMNMAAATTGAGDDGATTAFFDATTPCRTLMDVMMRVNRCNSMWHALPPLKGPAMIPQMDLMQMILHLLQLVTATVPTSSADNDDNASLPRTTTTTTTATLYYENVGGIFHFSSSGAAAATTTTTTTTTSGHQFEPFVVAGSREELQNELKQRRLALPLPTRETLLMILANLMGKKDSLRGVSNAAIFTTTSSSNNDDDNNNANNNNNEEEDRVLFILHWQPLLRLLLRTAPYLDEYSSSDLVTDASARMGSVLKRTVRLIRDARHYFAQGIGPVGGDDDGTGSGGGGNSLDQSAREIWNMLQTDVRFCSHTHACFRGTILLYLFLPTRCSSSFYQSVLPHWFDSWTNIDSCPEYDFLWLALLCRARKHIADDAYDWSMIRKRILSLSQYWLQLPIGGAALDKSFPPAHKPAGRSCPARLKVFVGTSNIYSEGLDFVTKVTKLLVAGLGQGMATSAAASASAPISEGTNDVLRFLTFVSPYFNPSNIGRWTYSLGAFLQAFSYELCCRLGAQVGQACLRESHAAIAAAFAQMQPMANHEIPGHELVLILDALMPLCQQALYSKNGHVSRCGEAALRCLTYIDPRHTTPAFIDFACQALDVSAINQSHQAPAALSALARLLQPALRIDPTIVFQRLPQLLRLTLAGIDSNDYDKTTRTLIFYRSLASWVPLGGSEDSWKVLHEEKADTDSSATGHGLYRKLQQLTDSEAFVMAVDSLPETSPLKLSRTENYFGDGNEAIQEASLAASDWVLEFLDRIFILLRATGSKEKSAERNGVKHVSTAVLQSKNFSRVLKETLLQVFASMDNSTFKLALRSVCRFIEEETLPCAAKDCSILCQAAAACRDGVDASCGLDDLVPLLASKMTNVSNNTTTYRLRCLAGAVRSASMQSLLRHSKSIAKSISIALSSDDKHVFKTGCKLMRHVLAASLEPSLKNSDMKPQVFRVSNGGLCFGRSAQLKGSEPQWQVPSRDLIDFACTILKDHVVRSIKTCWTAIRGDEGSSKDLTAIRRCLSILQYAMRGASGAFLDFDEKYGESQDGFVPHERATCMLLASHKVLLFTMRKEMCTIVLALSRIISVETFYGLSGFESSGEAKQNLTAGFMADSKTQKKVCDVALLLLTRRGSRGFKSQEAIALWRAMKRLDENYTFSNQCSYIWKVLQSASADEATNMKHRDGEESGKTITRRLVLIRLQVFLESLQRSASFDIPRRLRRQEHQQRRRRMVLYSIPTGESECRQSIEQMEMCSESTPLDVYEGLIDGLYAFCCHSSGLLIDPSMRALVSIWARFGWVVRERTMRLVSTLSLSDRGCHGKFGLPSCSLLQEALDVQGKRKRLAAAVKGISQLLGQSRSTDQLLRTHQMRLRFFEMITTANDTVSLLPEQDREEMILRYFLLMFSPFRSKIYYLPTSTSQDLQSHQKLLYGSMSMLVDGPGNGAKSTSEQWRKKLISCWALLTSLGNSDLKGSSRELSNNVWKSCFHTIENEPGQPIQRLALGLLGRLMTIQPSGDGTLSSRLVDVNFVAVLGNALVYDHKEDASIAGGQDAQWAVGIEELVRDSARNLAPRTLFPFQRTNQAFGSFKASHAQLVETLLLSVDGNEGSRSMELLMSFAKDCCTAPPSEDHRNQQAAAAEIFAGLCGSYLRRPTSTYEQTWQTFFLPHLENAVNSLPLSFCGAYFDALRYALQFCSPSKYLPLTEWLVAKIESTIWQPSDDTQVVEVQRNSSDGFTTQSKWLYLLSSLLIELDETELGRAKRSLWYEKCLSPVDEAIAPEPVSFEEEPSWRIIRSQLLPKMVLALGHPFENCREYIALSLFRICYCHRKHERYRISAQDQRLSETNDDIGSAIVEALSRIDQFSDKLSLQRLNALNTARRFISYSIALGEAKFEYSEYVIPLLPLAFGSIRSTKTSESDSAETAALRTAEAELISNFKHTIAEISVTSTITYGRDSDIPRVLDVVAAAAKDEHWHVRHAAAHFLRCFQSAHCFKFSDSEALITTDIIAGMLSDERQEVSSAATSALIGILATTSSGKVASMVDHFSSIAGKATKTKKNNVNGVDEDQSRALAQQKSVFFLCAAILSQPYDTPRYVPVALTAISKHSFEKNAPLNVRSVVKRCCAEYKRTHMSDDWPRHRKFFSMEQLEALDDVVSTPHYYA